jgi:hypothetical protein
VLSSLIPDLHFYLVYYLFQYFQAYPLSLLLNILNTNSFLILIDSLSYITYSGRFGDRIPVGARFFAHVQTGPGAHPASYTVGTGPFPG